MKFLHIVEKSSDRRLKKLIDYRIKRLERKNLKNNPNVTSVGYQVDYTPTIQDFVWDGEDYSLQFMVRCFYNQFLPKNMKVVYGLGWDSLSGRAGNRGNYYYMDDQEYLYDFCKFIKDKEIVDEYEFFGYIRDSLSHYFGVIPSQDRDEMHNLLVDKNGNYITPHKEHSIKDFKGKGNALCSEYASMAHNILRLFDFESYLVIGNMSTSTSKNESHAYNMITFKEEDTKETKHVVVDFLNPVYVYDMNYQLIGDEPFIGFIESLDQDFVNRFVNGEEHLEFDEYGYSILGDTLLKFSYDRTREYFVDTHIYGESTVKKSKTYTYHK